ncbi:MAG TPA: amylo-alpha-1,6-glucosidase [Kofleriaceae bacterium]|nr:amylo-alpha-1,6-glucosidase [Kofleriaceae bacterium]
MTDPQEWLEPDGLGGFAMGAADGIRTRRYHALLLAALQPPDRRMVLVADVEVYAVTAAGRFALSSHRYRGNVIHPGGVRHLRDFAGSPWPRWTYVLPDHTQITCELVVEPGAPRVALRWTRVISTAAGAGDGPITLEVRPLLAVRDYHSLRREGPIDLTPELAGNHVTWRPDGIAIHAHANAAYTHAPDWYRGFDYVAERARGLDHEEDLAMPGTFTFDLASSSSAAWIGFSTSPWPEPPAELFEREARRRKPIALHDRAADAYLVARGEGRTIIAGYPWFCDWGRDTFISLRGLCLARDRREIAREILLAWAPLVSGGMLPNRFHEHSSAPEFNSVDAALWYVIAVAAYREHGEVAAADERVLAAAIDQIVTGYARGTRHRIAADTDGLLACGEPGLQLTWMDAKIGDHVVTPRVGKPVEVQALWLNALAIAGRTELLARGRASFGERFWDAERHQLYDVIDCDHIAGRLDPTCRPNQLFAVGGLPLQLLDGDRARAVVDTCERCLWTPVGPRSLATFDPRYRGRYVGDPAQRDHAYHNGPVWPWLAGAFVEAWLRVRGTSDAAKREAHDRFVAPLRARAVGGHLAEIYEGDIPHHAVGAPMQAWSVGELIRLEHLVR